MEYKDAENKILRSRILEELSNIKERFTMQFKVIIATLLGQEWTSPSPLYCNQDSEGILWLSVEDSTGYPDKRWCEMQSLRDCIEELAEKEIISHEAGNYLLVLVDKIPYRFEVDEVKFIEDIKANASRLL